MGRCGRDGQQAEAILYFNNTDLSKSKKHVTDSIRKFCRLKSCRRKFLMEYFGSELAQPDTSRCCDVCSGRAPEDPPPAKRMKPDDDISATLQYYFNEENGLVTANCKPGLSTGLCQELANLISCQPREYVEKGNLEADFPFLRLSYMDNIRIILSGKLAAQVTEIMADCCEELIR